jgi:hypothetical protein
MANTLSSVSSAGHADGRAALATEQQIRVAVHKKCVIWLTITPAGQVIDASEKYPCDQGGQLTESVVTGPLLVRNSGVS